MPRALALRSLPTVASVVLGSALAVGCGSAPVAAGPFGTAAVAPSGALDPIAAPCEAPEGEVLEHWRAAREAGLVALKTRDAVGNSHTHYRTPACGALTEAQALARLDAATRARWLAHVEAVANDTLVVQVWLGSVREVATAMAPADIDRAREARVAAFPLALRRLLAPIPGTFATVGRVTKGDARAIAALPDVRALHAYGPFAAPAPSEAGRALGAPPLAGGGGIAVFDDCAEEGSGLERASYAAAVGSACVHSPHGTAVSRLAFHGAAAPAWSAGLTTASTDAPESLASPALWALRVVGARVLVQTIHTVAGDDANDALDLLVAEAAYPHALVVRAAGNGLPAELVVHRVLGGLDVGALGADGRPLASARTANATSAFGDVERPSLAASGVADALDGATQGTSFATPRVGAAAARVSLGAVPSAAAQLRAHLLAGAGSVPCAPEPGAAQRRHEDAVVGAGALREGARIVASLHVPAARFDATGSIRMELPHSLGVGRLRAALVFTAAAGAHPFDPARARADLDLRMVDAGGATVAASQSFDDDQEVTAFDAGRARAIVVERANGEPFFDAYLAVGVEEAAADCTAP